MFSNGLNNFSLSKSFAPKTVLAFIIFALLIFSGLLGAGCGKRTSPVPPVEKISQRAEIRGFQQGAQINLAWTLPPQRNVSPNSSLRIARADIYRLTEPRDASVGLTEDEFAARATLIASLPVSDADSAGREVIFSDPLEFAGQPVRLRYAIRFVNAAGQKAAFSNFFQIEPTALVASAPLLEPAVVTQDEILLEWRAPNSNADGSRPLNILGYNVYRAVRTANATSVRNPGVILNSTPVGRTAYGDRNFEFERTYEYFVRAVSLGTDGRPVESLDSNSVIVTPRDTFAPTAPSAITVAAAPGTISIFFAANQENDIAGYRIFRALNPDLEKTAWQNLTPDLLTSNTFQDTRIEAGKTFYYYVTAVDKFGNQSPPSEVVSETAF